MTSDVMNKFNANIICIFVYAWFFSEDVCVFVSDSEYDVHGKSRAGNSSR
jgi:hypothetical protein